MVGAPLRHYMVAVTDRGLVVLDVDFFAKLKPLAPARRLARDSLRSVRRRGVWVRADLAGEPVWIVSQCGRDARAVGH